MYLSENRQYILLELLRNLRASRRHRWWLLRFAALVMSADHLRYLSVIVLQSVATPAETRRQRSQTCCLVQYVELTSVWPRGLVL